MTQAQELLKSTMEELDKLLQSKTVVGDPMKIEDETVVPLLNIGFGFGAGGGINQKEKGEGSGSGAGAGIKPSAVLIFGKNKGVRVERLSPSFAESLGEAAVNVSKVFSEKEKTVE